MCTGISVDAELVRDGHIRYPEGEMTSILTIFVDHFPPVT